MTPEEFRAIRLSFGLKKPDFMYALGYQGTKNTMYLNCDRYENGSRPIPLYLARYVWLLSQIKTLHEKGISQLRWPVEWPDEGEEAAA